MSPPQTRNTRFTRDAIGGVGCTQRTARTVMYTIPGAGAAAPQDISSKLPTDVSQLLKSGPGSPGLGGARFPGLPGLGGFAPKQK